MRYETLDMRFLLTVGFSLRTRTDNMKNTEAIRTHSIPSPLAEKVAAGGRTPVQLPNPFRHLMTEEVFFHPPAPASGGEWQGVIPSLRSKRGISNNTRMLPPLPSSDSGTELPFAKFYLLSAATFSSERRRNLFLRQLQTLFRWLKPTAIEL